MKTAITILSLTFIITVMSFGDKVNSDATTTQHSQSVLDTFPDCPSGHEWDWWVTYTNGLFHWVDKKIEEEDTPASLWAGECSATIADKNGDLLFYYDGKRLYNRNHQRMKGTPNGSNALGDASRTQCLILRQPGQDSLFYLFYGDAGQPGDIPKIDTTKKLYYGIINIKGDNGLGELTSYGNLLLQPSTEKVTAARHCNGRDWWILGSEGGGNCYYAWTLTDRGLNLTPVISCIGKGNNGLDAQKAGYMKICHDLAHMASVVHANLNGKGHLEYFDFDNSSGLLSNARLIVANLYDVYGVEFSSDNTKLYISETFQEGIYQYDLTSEDATTIGQSQVFLKTRGNKGALSLGPDDRIYLSRWNNHFTVINNPNEKGAACDLEEMAVKLQRHETGLGLTNSPANAYFPYRLYARGDRELCIDSIGKYYLTDNCPHDGLVWDVSEGGEIVQIVDDTAYVKFTKTGDHIVSVTEQTDCGQKYGSVEVKVNCCGTSIDFNWMNVDTILCSGSVANFIWQTNADSLELKNNITNEVILSGSVIELKDLLIGATTTYRMSLFSKVGCDTSFEFTVRIMEAPTTYDSVHICSGDSIFLLDKWIKDEGDFEQSYQGGVCDSTAFLNVKYWASFTPQATTTKTCIGEANGSVNIAVQGTSSYKYQWSDGEYPNQRANLKKGEYEVIIIDENGCQQSIQFEIKTNPSINYKINQQSASCPEETDGNIIVQNKDDISTVWIDNQQRFEQVNLAKGTYNIVIIDTFGCLYYDTIHLNEGLGIDGDIPIQYTINDGEEIQLIPTITIGSAMTYEWSPSANLSCMNCASPMASPDQNTDYTVTIIDSNGCMIILETRVVVTPKEKQKGSIYIPNSFSPNGDGINDLFDIFLSKDHNFTDIKLHIFNRWGEQVYSCIDASNCSWDGRYKNRNLPSAVYVYILSYRNENGKDVLKDGSVTLIR